MKYSDSGVDIDKATAALKGLGERIKSTWGERVLSEEGAFGGLFDLSGIEEPVLVSSIDGVGTKLKLAFATGRHAGVGQDIVNHCVDDILVQGAKPLFFMDYFATGQLEPPVIDAVVGGMAEACNDSGCALLGGETAEMPGFYAAGEYDLAGCIVGVVGRSRIVTGKRIEPGDRIIGFASTGLHTNGYSLARRVLLDDGPFSPEDSPPALGCTVADALLAVHRSYLPIFSALEAQVDIRGMIHVTGGGFFDNIPRILPDRCGAHIFREAWDPLPIFRLIAEAGTVAEEEMFRVFNMGAGFLMVLSPDDARKVLASPPDFCLGEIGEIVAGQDGVILV